MVNSKKRHAKAVNSNNTKTKRPNEVTLCVQRQTTNE